MDFHPPTGDFLPLFESLFSLLGFFLCVGNKEEYLSRFKIYFPKYEKETHSISKLLATCDLISVAICNVLIILHPLKCNLRNIFLFNHIYTYMLKYHQRFT